MKWTKRKSGEFRTTINVRYHVPKAMVEFITEYTGGHVRESAAMKFIRSHAGQLVDPNHALAVKSEGYGQHEVIIIHIDDADTVEADGFHVYDGPEVV